jgi:nitroreductase
MNEMELFETIHSSRALRRFKPDPVPDDALARILDAAIRAPSAGNGQNWLFVVVKSHEQRQRIAEIYRRAGAMVAGWSQTSISALADRRTWIRSSMGC